MFLEGSHNDETDRFSFSFGRWPFAPALLLNRLHNQYVLTAHHRRRRPAGYRSWMPQMVNWLHLCSWCVCCACAQHRCSLASSKQASQSSPSFFGLLEPKSPKRGGTTTRTAPWWPADFASSHPASQPTFGQIIGKIIGKFIILFQFHSLI